MGLETFLDGCTMPTGMQLRAARAMLGWSTEKVAEKAGVNKESVGHAERETRRPLKETMDKIVRTYNENCILFVGENGVTKTTEDFRIFSGADCYLRLLSEVKSTLEGKEDAEALFICVDDLLSTKEVTAANHAIRSVGIKCRYLCSEKARHFDFNPKDYRAIPEKFYTNSVMIIYGDRVATLRGTNDTVRIVIDEHQAEMQRGLFQLVWLQARKIDPAIIIAKANK